MKDQLTELEQLEKDIEAERLATAELRAQTDAAGALERKKLELAKVKLEREKEALIAKFATELGPRGHKWEILETELGPCVIVRPSKGRYDEWVAAGMKTEASDVMALVSPCVKGMALTRFAEAIDNQPAKLSTALVIVNRLAGSNLKEIEGK